MHGEDLEFTLSQYLDGTLSDAERALVEERLRTDSAARELLQEYRALDELVREALPELPAVQWDRFAAHLSAMVEEQAVPSRSYSIAWVRGLVGLALAASVLIVVGLLAPHLNRQGAPAPVALQNPAVHPQTFVEVTGPQAEPAAGPATVEVSVGRPELALAASGYADEDGVVVQRPHITLASAMDLHVPDSH